MNEIRPHILVIDREPSFLDIVRLILEGEGNYHVTTMQSGAEDLAEVTRLQPDLILLEVQMQGRKTGWTFLQKLKLHRPTKDIPIVICTAALADVQEQEALFRQKGIPVLYKPFDIDDLLHVVEQALGTSIPKYI